MSEEDYRFRRPEHGYGTRLRLKRGERVDDQSVHITDPEDSHTVRMKMCQILLQKQIHLTHPQA